MNYQKIYNSLVERGKTRKLNCYVESHHIIPRCVGGSDDKTNLVDLTPEEHYLAHLLLVRIYPGNHSLVKSAAMMIPNRPSNKLYGWLRRKFSEVQSVGQSGNKNSQYGTRWVHNPITKQSKKIKGQIEHGWLYGKYKEPKPVLDSKLKMENQVKLYTEYYEIYRKVGFDKFVEITGYTKTKQNLVQRFAKLVEEFIPQNGKKR